MISSRLFFALCFLFSAATALAQTGQVSGRLADSVSGQKLASASVSVMRSGDSAGTAGFGISDKDGSFLVRNLAPGSYRLLITYQGYAPLVRRFSVTADQPSVNLATLVMNRSGGDMLQAVTVEAPPIRIREDTVEYAASAFKVKPNAFAEDMLKKLPGVQVDKDGNVTAQGEQVQKVYVDGKEFFGTDPKLATKNITADMIESVQVFDDMSDQAKFTHIDDGSRQKALNIKLKKDKRKGYFGRAIGGYGTDDRYLGSLSFNRFNENQRFSLIGASNNVNQQGFTFSDIVTSMGGFGSRRASSGGGGGFGGGFGAGAGGSGFRGGGAATSVSLGTGTTQTGITKTYTGGLNYTDEIGKLKITGSYFFARNDNTVKQNSYQQNLFPDDSVTNATTQSAIRTVNQNHRINLRLEYALDSMTSILYIPALTLQHSETYEYDTVFTQAVSKRFNYLANQGYIDNSTDKNGTSFNQNLLIRHKFKTVGRTLTIGWQNTINQSRGQGQLFSPLHFYFPEDDRDSIYLQDLQNSQRTKANNNTISLSYTEPVGRGQLIELNYAYTNNYGTSDNRAFNYDSATKNYTEINEPLTNYFGNGYYAHRVGTNYRLARQKYSLQIGMGVQFSQMTSHVQQALGSKDTIYRQDFTNLFPVVSFNYKFATTKNLRFTYRGHTNQPSITQLQNVQDVSNPLQVQTGNPLLKPEFENNVNIRYNSFSSQTFRFLSVNVTLDNQYNNIVNSIQTLRPGVLLIKPVNMDGTYSGNSFVTLGFPLKGKLQGSNINFNNSIAYSHTPSLLYGQENMSKSLTITQTAGVNLAIKEKLNLGLNGSFSYNHAAYTLEDSLNSNFYQQTYTADISWTFVKNWILYTDFNEYINTGRSAGFNQTIPLWNASIACEILKKRNGEIKFSVNDILNQNQSVTRTITDRYVLDTRSSVLQRYFMLTFTYNLNQAGLNNRKNRGVPPMIQRQMDQLGVPPGGGPPGGGGPGGGGPRGGAPGGGGPPQL